MNQTLAQKESKVNFTPPTRLSYQSAGRMSRIIVLSRLFKVR